MSVIEPDAVSVVRYLITKAAVAHNFRVHMRNPQRRGHSEGTDLKANKQSAHAGYASTNAEASIRLCVGRQTARSQN